MSKKLTKETIQAWVHLHRAHRQSLDSVEKALKQNDLPPLDWYDVLIELHREKSNGLRQYEIGKKILLKKHNLSRLIDRLEDDQLIRRYTCSEDGRGSRIKITDKGEKMLKQIWPTYSNAIQNVFGVKLEPKELAELSQILKKVVDPS